MDKIQKNNKVKVMSFKDDDKLYGGIFYNEDCTLICLNVKSELPISSAEFFAYVYDFMKEHSGEKVQSIGELVDLEFEEEDLSLIN